MIKKIGLYIGIITGVLAIGATIYNWGVKHEQKKAQDTTIEAKVDRLIVSDSLQTIYQRTVMDSIHKLSNQLRFYGREFSMMKQSDENLKNYMMKNAATKDDVMEVLQIWEVKKNEQPIALRNLE